MNSTVQVHLRPYEVKMPFAEAIDSTTVILAMAEELRDIHFAGFFGKIQRMADPRVRSADGPQEIRIDFRSCRWADPTPLLHLAIFLREFADRTEHNRAEVLFPDASDAPRLLKFLSEEGFADLFLGLRGMAASQVVL